MSLSQAAQWLGVSKYTMRVWETKYGLNTEKDYSGKRFYSEAVLTEMSGICILESEGFPEKIIRLLLKNIKEVMRLEAGERKRLLNRLQQTLSQQEEPVQTPVVEPVGTAPDAQLVKQQETGVTEAAQGTQNTDFLKVFEELMKTALLRNNERLGEAVSERLVRELRFLFQEKESLEEERFRELDRTIREYQEKRRRKAYEERYR